MSLGLHEQAPRADGDHQAAADPRGARADAEGSKDIGPQPKRSEQDDDRKGVDPSGQGDLLGLRPTLGDLVEHQRRADGIDDRERRRKGEKERANGAGERWGAKVNAGSLRRQRRNCHNGATIAFGEAKRSVFHRRLRLRGRDQPRTIGIELDYAMGGR